MSRCCLGEHLLEDEETEVFMRRMLRQAAFCGVDLLAYSIMSNHFHILAQVRHEKPPTEVFWFPIRFHQTPSWDMN
ncbi:MAG: hypothetical protein JW706_12005 [Opitutales bacterium]|nr:hypothetical protein [Opitutales bacterium]